MKISPPRISNTDLTDIQTLALDHHGDLPESGLLLLRCGAGDVAPYRDVLSQLGPEIAFGLDKTSPDSALQILFTSRGLKRLAPHLRHSRPLDAAFLEGMEGRGAQRTHRGGDSNPSARSHALGDVGPSAPDNWSWSDWDNDIALLLYATNASVRDALRARVSDVWTRAGGSVQFHPSQHLEREMFGFHDGVTLSTIHPSQPYDQAIAPGEIVLGQTRTDSTVATEFPEFARNGTYVVVRQLSQDVAGFWDYWRRAADEFDQRYPGTTCEARTKWLAAKAMGMWPNGMPLDLGMDEPPFDARSAYAPRRFGDDPRGTRCPLGSHIRRANPFGADHEREILKFPSVLPRILRRGRTFGTPILTESMPQSVCEALARQGGGEVGAFDSGTPEERGLFFTALCSDVAEQFELIQQLWLNHSRFVNPVPRDSHGAPLDRIVAPGSVDPIAAGHGLAGDEGRFVIPTESSRHRVSGLRRWVEVRGGGYFFMPGRTGLNRILGTLPT